MTVALNEKDESFRETDHVETESDSWPESSRLPWWSAPRANRRRDRISQNFDGPGSERQIPPADTCMRPESAGRL